MDVHVGEIEAPDDDPFPELMPEVLPGPEVLPEHEPEVLRAPLSLHHLLDRAKPSMAEAASLGALLAWVRERGVNVVSADLTVPGSPTAQLEAGSTAVPLP